MIGRITLKYSAYIYFIGNIRGFASSRLMRTPPGRRTRAISSNAIERFVKFLVPNPIVTASNILSANGNLSTSPSRTEIFALRSSIFFWKRSSMGRVISRPITCASGICSTASKARSPVPQATSRMCGCVFSISAAFNSLIAFRRHDRSNPKERK